MLSNGFVHQNPPLNVGLQLKHLAVNGNPSPNNDQRGELRKCAEERPTTFSPRQQLWPQEMGVKPMQIQLIILHWLIILKGSWLRMLGCHRTWSQM